MVPKGRLLIIGGAEEREGKHPSEEMIQGDHFEVLKTLLPDNEKKDRIEVITSASSVPDELTETYKQTFKKLGYTNIGFLDIRDKIQARDIETIQRIEDTRVVFFTGGDQLKLATVIGGTDVGDAIRCRYQEDTKFLVAGTSAGAMAMSIIMIAEGSVSEALLAGDLQTSAGLALANGCIIDTHFIKRGRFSRLAQAIALNPQNLGIGLGEDAALLITKGNKAKCIGTGMVILIDGCQIAHTNIAEASKDEPIYVEGLKVHVLTRNCSFDIKSRRIDFEDPMKSV
ncbi:cyanophycinase [Sphingobacterium paucimobilis]|uniref:Cyanophycinase n=1 Tax=Sphingobacterium paucimobilis HER1398 TaxID=1346330 RepID=U2HVJ1_9SPHI|nr:cyanophycinase [Sphingobacterium paucimobilis]ERJ59290.1 hypothetical protein M472_10940 [Sphingobacterium paucimobilis HER1398]